jgi:S1-C subfamily serine protease
MEHTTIILDDGTGREFDARVHGPDVLPDYGDLEIVTKDGATKAGRPIVVLTFHVNSPLGKLRAQTVTTARMLVTAARAIEAKYPDMME